VTSYNRPSQQATNNKPKQLSQEMMHYSNALKNLDERPMNHVGTLANSAVLESLSKTRYNKRSLFYLDLPLFSLFCLFYWFDPV
jgi:hypothetical protein